MVAGFASIAFVPCVQVPEMLSAGVGKSSGIVPPRRLIVSLTSRPCTGYLAHPFKKEGFVLPMFRFLGDFSRTDAPSSQYRTAP